MQDRCKQGGVAVMASSQSHLSGGKVNLAILRESYRRELLECLDKCQGSKVIHCFFCFKTGIITNTLHSIPVGSEKLHSEICLELCQ